jgi:integrase
MVLARLQNAPNSSGGGAGVSKPLAADSRLVTPENTTNAVLGGSGSKPAGKAILDRKDIPGDRNAYVFRDAKRGGRWCLYFYDRETTNRHRFVLKDGNGVHPPATPEAQEQAWMLGISKFVELKGKSDRGEAIQSLSWGEMVEKFLQKERRRVSEIPHNGITKTRYRLLENQCRWLSDYVHADDKKVHLFRRNAFLNYEIWRKERALEFEKQIPKPTTINQELSTLRRMFSEVAVTNGFLTRDSVPEIPNIKLPKDKKHRRDDLTHKEWEEIEKCARYYWIKGNTRLTDENGNHIKDSSGSWKVKPNIKFRSSARGKTQLRHRNMIYWAMRISMDTGIRIGSLRKMKWKHITENTSIPKEERKVWVAVNVPPENTKTGRSYRMSAPIARSLQELRKHTDFKRPDDVLFVNQKTGQPFSDRAWKDSLYEMLVEAKIAEWAEDDSNNLRKINIHSGKTLSWYSFRHSYITMRLQAGTPVAIIAANTDTSLKYIQEHYFHYRADESTGALGKGRAVRPALADLTWIDRLETTADED